MAHPDRRLSITNRSAVSHLRLRASRVLMLSCLMCSCAKHEAVKTPAPQSSPAAQGQARTQQPPSPTLAEVNEAVTRVFKDAATIDSRRQPNFFAGDFNGDASQDIAVFVQPATGKLAEINQDLPPWILKDPLTAAGRPASPLRIEPNELLLAIIHGYGPNGWRDAQATQTYLLKSAAGLEVKAGAKGNPATVGQEKKEPRFVGDLIGASLRGKSGYLYFTGAQYSWFDPGTFKGEAEARLTHRGTTPKRNRFDLLHPKLVAAEK